MGQDRLQRAFDLCVGKTRRNIKRLADNPKSYAWAVDGDYFAFPEGFFEIGNWTSSFFTGMALLAWKETGDDYFLRQAQRLAPSYCDKVFKQHEETMHDLGFLYSLYSVALHKLTGDKAHREVGLRAAKVLAARFVPNGGYIRAWGRMDEQGTDYAGLAIIDCMMNLPLLFWASQETGDRKFHDIAVAHADTTLKHFVRADDSVFHAFRFDPVTGKSAGGANYCGHAIPSHWARGTAWAIYGFALAHGHTHDRRYLDVSRRLARRFIQCLDAEVVPVWDFKLSPGIEPIRDSSAGAIAVCGLKELARHDSSEGRFSETANRLLSRLCTEDYLNFDAGCPGVLRNAQVGDGPARAQNVYASWGDYFLMEALGRELFQAEVWW